MSETDDVAQRHARLAELYDLRLRDPDAWSKLSTQETG